MVPHLVLTIDALRREVFYRLLSAGRLPHLARLLGRHERVTALDIPALSTLPSITFSCSATIATGCFPREHGITGNQFFDRCGELSGGKAKFYSVDPHSLQALRQCLAVYGIPGLLNKLMPAHLPTMYESMREIGNSSVVSFNMGARGADKWIRPAAWELGRLLKGRSIFKLTPADYDALMVNRALRWISRSGVPKIISLYFLGIDFLSHHCGPHAQDEYLEMVLDPMIGRFAQTLRERHDIGGFLTTIVSDHGHVEVEHPGAVSLPRIVGQALKVPGLRSVEAVSASNGGLGHLYLRAKGARWDSPPALELLRECGGEILRRNSEESEVPRGAIKYLLLRNAARDGWSGDYQVLTSDGGLCEIDEIARTDSEIAAVDLKSRLCNVSCSRSGDLILLSDYAAGYYFGHPSSGMHGGYVREESECVFAVGASDLPSSGYAALTEIAEAVVTTRCGSLRQPSIADVAPLVCAVTEQVATTANARHISSASLRG